MVLIHISFLPIICILFHNSTTSIGPKAAAKIRKRAASNVAETVTTKKAWKAKQQALPEEPELVGGDQGEEEGPLVS